MSDIETTVQVSDEEVQASRERVEQLREELAETQQNLSVSEASRTNAVRKARLDREADSLEAQLQAARDRLATSQNNDDATNITENSTATADQANVNSETGEVNPEEVERLTDYPSDEDEE